MWAATREEKEAHQSKERWSEPMRNCSSMLAQACLLWLASCRKVWSSRVQAPMLQWRLTFRIQPSPECCLQASQRFTPKLWQQPQSTQWEWWLAAFTNWRLAVLGPTRCRRRRQCSAGAPLARGGGGRAIVRSEEKAVKKYAALYGKQAEAFGKVFAALPADHPYACDRHTWMVQEIW